MLSSKLKSWMESHLTRKKSSGSSNTSSKKSASTYHGGSNSSASYKELSPADRIAHPASGLVNLVPAVPLCSTSGRSNAGLVIRLQNDFRENQHSAAVAAAAAASPCHLRHPHQQHHPSWTRSPVMLAWNTKIAAPSIPPPQRPIDPPMSTPSHCSSTIQQVRLIFSCSSSHSGLLTKFRHFIIHPLDALLSRKIHFHASLIVSVIVYMEKRDWICLALPGNLTDYHLCLTVFFICFLKIMAEWRTFANGE